MLRRFTELQKDTNSLKFIKTVEGTETPTHYYHEFIDTNNIELDIMLDTKRLVAEKLAELSRLRDNKLNNMAVTYKNMIAKTREKDVAALSTLALTGGTYVFENGILELTTTQAKEVLKLVSDARTNIVIEKQEWEKKIREMEYVDLHYFNINCNWL